jgi:hypothetical protein
VRVRVFVVVVVRVRVRVRVRDKIVRDQNRARQESCTTTGAPKLRRVDPHAP